MKLRRVVLSLAILLILAAIVDRGFCKPADVITVNNAAEVREDSVSMNQRLVDSAASVAPRTETVSNPLYVREHEVTLTGLSPGATYYYRISSVDQSGNVYEGSEETFTVQLRVFLPSLRR